MNEYLIVDVGGTSIKYAVFREDGTMLRKDSQPKKENTMPDLVESIGQMMERELPHAAAIGVACNLVLNPYTGEMYGGSTYEMDGDAFPLRDALKERCGVPVVLIKDSNAALLAELRTGSLQGAENALGIILGTGIGMGIFLNGKIIIGDDAFAGEASMMMIGNPHDDVPQQNCWMRYNSVPYFVMRAAAAIGRDPAEFDGKQMFDLINAGDPTLCAMFEEYCDTLSVQLMNLVSLLDVHRIAIGGGISAQPLLLEKLQEKVAVLNRKLRPSSRARTPEIVACTYRNDANLYGTFYNLMDEMAEA